MYLICGPRQLFFFQCGAEMPKGGTPLEGSWHREIWGFDYPGWVWDLGGQVAPEISHHVEIVVDRVDQKEVL